MLAACGGGAAAPDAGFTAPDSAASCHGGSSACDQCGDTSCCAQAQACSNNLECTQAYACAAQCAGDSACTSQCSTQYPSGIGPANALATCLDANCSAECTSPTPVSPFGMWTLIVTFHDTDGEVINGSRSFTISPGTGEYEYDTECNIQSCSTTGSISCTATDCTFDETTTFPNGAATQTEIMDLTLAADGSIVGTGSETNPALSNATLTIIGTKSD
jgi:hypothetical protein